MAQPFAQDFALGRVGTGREFGFAGVQSIGLGEISGIAPGPVRQLFRFRRGRGIRRTDLVPDDASGMCLRKPGQGLDQKVGIRVIALDEGVQDRLFAAQIAARGMPGSGHRLKTRTGQDLRQDGFQAHPAKVSAAKQGTSN